MIPSGRRRRGSNVQGLPRRYRDLALTFAGQVRRAGALPIFVNLYCNGGGYAADRPAPAVRDVAADMAGQLRFGWLRDGTHSTPLGAKLYDTYRFLPVVQFRAPCDSVMRSGIELPVADLRPGERISGRGSTHWPGHRHFRAADCRRIGRETEACGAGDRGMTQG